MCLSVEEMDELNECQELLRGVALLKIHLHNNAELFITLLAKVLWILRDWDQLRLMHFLKKGCYSISMIFLPLLKVIYLLSRALQKFLQKNSMKQFRKKLHTFHCHIFLRDFLFLILERRRPSF